MELQIGGQDAAESLWPIESGENRSSGSKVKPTVVSFVCDDKKPNQKKFEDLENNRFWFKLQSGLELGLRTTFARAQAAYPSSAFAFDTTG